MHCLLEEEDENLQILLQDYTLKNVFRFKYVGSTIEKSSNLDMEIQHRLSCTTVAVQKLNKRSLPTVISSHPPN